MREVYIVNLASFLPNQPIKNGQIENVLGMVQQTPSRTRNIVLRHNRIRERYFALDPETGRATHSNAQITVEAIRHLLDQHHLTPKHIECLCCGTSSPDQLMPGHGVMVHGALGGGPCEVMTAAGICLSGISAMKYAYMNVKSGEVNNAVATGSELASSFLKAGFYDSAVSLEKMASLEKDPTLAFEEDFLRWMLSDGAGAALLNGEPNPNGIALRIDWMEQKSFAHQFETCMYAGAIKNPHGGLTGWRAFSSLTEAMNNNAFSVKQDVKLLNKEIVKTVVDRMLPPLIKKYHLKPSEIDWFLPHYSSDYFRKGLGDRMRHIGFDVDEKAWFTNLSEKGNTGAASIYIILDDLFHSGRLLPGERLLCMIPESGRFSVCYMMLTVV